MSASVGRDWPSTGQFTFTVDDPSNIITVGGTLVSSTPVQGTALHLATITFLAVQPGLSNITGVVHTLARRVSVGEVATNIGSIPRTFTAGAVQVMVSSTRQRRSIQTSNTFHFSRITRIRRQAMTTCPSQRQTGDVDGNCVFDVRDVSFLQIYYLSTIVTGVQPPIPEDRRVFLDADLNGEVNANDVVFLLRVNFRLLRFASELTFLPILLTNEDCMIEINVTLVSRGDDPADSTSSVLLFDIANESPGFQAMFDASVVTVGRVVTTDKGPGLYGGLIEASYYGGGVYGIRIDSALGQAPFGISPIQVTFDADNMTAPFRTAAMFSQGIPLYNSIDASIVLRGQTVSINTQLGYSPLLLANTSLDTQTCLRLRSALVFQNVTYLAMVSERASVGDSVITVTANSARPSPSITYSIISTSPFSIDPVSGLITVNQVLDYETVSMYSFTVMANEITTNGEIFTATTLVIVSLINENDNAPNITQPPVISLLATVPSGSPIYQIEATDPDNLDPLSYAIEGLSPFSIDSGSGTVRVASALLGAANTNVTVMFRVLDSSLSSIAQLTIDIYLPRFSQSSYFSNISEAALPGSIVTELIIDSSRNENFTFSLQSTSFSINESGIITVSSPLDFETQPTYTLNISATAPDIHIQTTVFISLMDVNDNAPVFSESSYNASISMGVFQGTVVTQLVATDLDSPGPNSDVSYSIRPSDNSDLFQILPFTGEVTVVQTLFQGPSAVVLIIVATDSGTPAMSSSTNLTIEILPTGIPTFAILPSVFASRTALAVSAPMGASTANSNSTTFLQMYDKLTAVDNGQLSALFTGSSKISMLEITTMRQLVSGTVAHVLHPTSNIYQESRDIVLAFQVRDANFFTEVTHTSIQRQIFLTNTNQVITSTSCSTIPATGICTIRLTIPDDWFTRSNSIVAGNVLLNGVSIPYTNETFSLLTTPILSQSFTSNILVEVPARDIISGTMFTANVYGYSPFYITGFSVVFQTQGPISVSNLVIDNSRWNALTNINRTHFGVTAILTTPGDADMDRDGNRMFLFSLVTEAVADISSDMTAIITAHVQSLSDVVESSLILDSSSSTSGPALFLSRSGLGSNGTISVVQNSIQAIHPYIQQPEILNTALLTGSNVNIPVQVYAGYASGEVLPYTQSMTCSSSEPLVINPDSSCTSLILTPNESSGSNSVNIIYTVGTVSGSLPIQVYAPTKPLRFVSTDLTLNRVQYSNGSSCMSYQQAELSIFTDFEAASSKVLSNISVTDLISPLLITSDTSIVELNGTTLQGRGPGEATICVANRADLGCLNVTVSSSTVNVASIVGSLLVQINLSTSQISNTTSGNVAEITARSQFQFLQEEGDLVVAVQFSDGAISSVSPNEITVLPPSDNSIYSLQGNTLVSTGSGEAIGQFRWTPLDGRCNIIFTNHFLVMSTLPTPTDLQTSLPPSPTVHFMTTTTETAAALIGLPSSLSISVCLVFPGGRLLDVSRDSRVSYISSSPAVSVSDGIITASEEGSVQLTIRYTAEVNLTVVIEIQVIVSAGLSLDAHPYPIYPGSTNTTLTTLSLIETTGVWQRAVLQVQLVLSNGTSVDITSFPQTEFRSNTLPPGQAIPEVQIAASPLPVLTVQGGSGVIQVVAMFLPHVTSTNISVLNNQVLVSAVAVIPFPGDTLRGIREEIGQTISVDLTFSDGTRLLSYPTNPALLGQMISGLVNYASTDTSFTASNNGELRPLANTHMPVSITVRAASSSSIFSEYNFFVNLDPDVGDVDIGMETGSAIPASTVASQVNLPVVINTGTSNIGSIDLLITYDPTIIEPTAVAAGTDFGMGIYESSLNDPPGDLRIGAAFSSDITGTHLHLFTISLQVLSSTLPDGSFFGGTVLTFATRTTDGSTIGQPTPRPIVAGNLTFTVGGRSKRASSSGEFDAGQLRDQSHVRHRRQAICSAPPCACSWMTPGDTDGNCLFDVRDVSFALLYINEVLVGSSGPVVSTVTPVQLTQLNPNQDGLIDTSDAFFLLRALFRLVYFLDSVSVTAVQDPLSQCLFSVNVMLGNVQEQFVRADVIIDLGFSDNSRAITNADIVTGDLLTSEKGTGLNGALVLAQPASEGLFSVQLNATFMSSSVGVSVVLVTYDALNGTSSSRSVQFFGQPPPLYPPLSVSLPLRGAQVIVAASSGYSPFTLASNSISSSQCSDLPILGPDLSVMFESPFQAHLSWVLLNLREGLNFSAELKVLEVSCILDQNTEISNCSGLVSHDASGSTTHSLATKPFTHYFLQVAGPTSSTNNVSVLSPDSAPVGLAPPLYTQKPEGTSFTWSLPMQPNGVITHYTLYVGPVAIYNDSSLFFSSTIVFQDTAEVVLEAHNSAGSVRSQSVQISPVVGSGPGVRGLSLTAEEAIIVAVILTGLIILVLVIILVCGMWKRKVAELAKKKPAFLSTDFEPENFEVEKGPLVLLPLNAQKEKHFEEKFAQESDATFWYKDEKTIELTPAQFDSLSSSGEDSDYSGGYNFDMDEAWGFGNVLTEKKDMSDLWVTEDLPAKKKPKKYSVIRKQPSGKKQSSSRLSGASILRRLSFSQQRRNEDEMALISTSSAQESPGQPDIMTETEMSNYHSQIRRLSDINSSSGNGAGMAGGPDLPPPSDETSAQVAARLRAALKEGKDMAEYRDLIAVRPTSQPTQAKLPFNSTKNRYRNVLPCDETRVKLLETDPLEEGSDYINASYLDGHGRARAYIATQGPLPNTVKDFWKMVWEQRSEVIVMVTQLEYQGRVKSEKYWPDKGHSRRYGGISVTCTSQKSREGYIISKFLVSSDADPNNKRSIIHYHFTEWPDFGCPSTKPLVDMVKTVGPSKPDKPMVVHCSAGLGRTGVLTAMHSVLECHVDRRHVDVQRTVSQMRQQREGMVQTQQQYKFCYEAIAEALAPSENVEKSAEDETFRPMSIPPPPYSESTLREARAPNQPIDASMESSLPSPSSSGQATPIKIALGDSGSSVDLQSVTPASVEPATSEFVEKDRERRSGVSTVHAVVEPTVNNLTSGQSISLPEVIVTAPSIDGLHQTVLEESHTTASPSDVPSPPVSAPIPLPPEPPESSPPEPPESIPPEPPQSPLPEPPESPLPGVPPPEPTSPVLTKPDLSEPPQSVPISPEEPELSCPKPPKTSPPSDPSVPGEKDTPAAPPPAAATATATAAADSQPNSICQSTVKEPKPFTSDEKPLEESAKEEEEVGFAIGDDQELNKENDEAGFSIGDDQILIQKPYKKESSKPTKSSTQPQWKSQTEKTGPSLGKWKQQQQKWREKQKETALSSPGQKPPVQRTWTYKKKQEEQEATAKAGLADKPEEKIVKSVVSTERLKTTQSPKPQQSEFRSTGKIKIPEIFGGAAQSSTPVSPLKSAPHSSKVPPPMVAVAVDKSLSSHPTPPSSPSVARKNLGMSSTVRQTEEREEGDTPVMRRIKELQKKSGTSSSLASGPVYKLPIKKITPSSPEKPVPSPAHVTGIGASDSVGASSGGIGTRANSSSHSADTSTGNVARLLSRFQ